MKALAKRVSARRAGQVSPTRGRKQATAAGGPDSGTAAVDVLDAEDEVAATSTAVRKAAAPVQTGPRNQPKKSSKSKRR